MNGKIVFCYLDVGPSQHIQTEIRYSVSTLLAEMDQSSSIVIYTDKPAAYKNYPATVIDTADTNWPSADVHYVYRQKPLALLHALETFKQLAVFVDSDTYMLPGFFNALRGLASKGCVVDNLTFEDKAAFPAAIHDALPNKAAHVLDRGRCLSGNSGLIALSGERGRAVLEDTIAIIDEVLRGGTWDRTLEQSAFFEALWLHGMPAAKIRPLLVHYCSQSKKRYMRRQIEKLFKDGTGQIGAMRPAIKFDPIRVKGYQYYFDVRKTFQPAWGARQISTWTR